MKHRQDEFALRIEFNGLDPAQPGQEPRCHRPTMVEIQRTICILPRGRVGEQTRDPTDTSRLSNVAYLAGTGMASYGHKPDLPSHFWGKLLIKALLKEHVAGSVWRGTLIKPARPRRSYTDHVSGSLDLVIVVARVEEPDYHRLGALSCCIIVAIPISLTSVPSQGQCSPKYLIPVMAGLLLNEEHRNAFQVDQSLD
jgi:hypothetical protein